MLLEINGHKIDTDYYVKKWTDWALQATPATDEQIKENIGKLYKKAGLKKPKEVKVYREWDEFKNMDWASVSVRVSVWNSVGSLVRASVGTSVWFSVWISIETLVRASVREPIWTSVMSSVDVSVLAAVKTSAWDPVWSPAEASARAFVGDFVEECMGSWYWAPNLAVANVFADVGLLPEEKIKELEELKKILETQRLGVLTKDVAYVLPAPIIRRNSRGFLHSDAHPAVQWGKSGLYFLNGVNFPKELWERVVSRQMPFGEILAIENIDQRVQAMKYGDLEVFLKEAKAELLDKSEKGNELYLIPREAGIFSRDAYFLKYKDPSTGRVYISGVDPEVGKKKNADEAMAWKHQFTLGEYYKLVES